MPVSIADFVQAAESTGILTADSLSQYLRGDLPEADASALADRLVTNGLLTTFQVKHIYDGKAKSLVLGPYVVLDVLGQGGMGYVYKAEHRKMRRVVALKVIARASLNSPAAVQRFEREVQAAARLEHPNIVTAHDAGEASGIHYLVMQFVDGRTLSEIVKALGPQPLARAVDWTFQAARGLAYAHGKGVVHRDIKPGNLLVDRDGTVKILDMGLARLETLDADQDQLTGTGQIMGTVDYMAPEQAMDTRQADARSDIYSLGVTLWYLLSGQPLFAGDTAMKKMMAHMQAPTPSLNSVRGDVPPDVDAVFQRMVAKKPDDRFQSMQEVLTSLQALPQGEAAPRLASTAFGGHAASLGALGTEATRTLQRRKVAAPDENTARLSAVDVDTDLGLKKATPQPQRSVGGLKPLHLVIGGGAVGALLLVGLMMFALGGRREVTTVDRGGKSGGASAAESASRLGAVESVAIAEPKEVPRAKPQSTAPAPTAESSTPPPLAISPFDATQARTHQEGWAKHLGIEVETTNSIGQTLVVIPPGRFTMREGDKTVDVTLTNPFLLGQTEVTQEQWKKVMGTEPWKGQPHTIEGTDVAATFMPWQDAVVFCEKLTQSERSSGSISREQAYRLPTEAEWEFAGRAGTVTAWSFGDDDSLLGDYGWFGGGWKDRPIPGGNTAGEMYAHAVRLKRPNPFGLYDIHGNVWEWCSDWYGEYGPGAVTDPQGLSRSSFRIIRGGCWYDAAGFCGSALRGQFTPWTHGYSAGFRPALGLPRAERMPPQAAKQSIAESSAPTPAIAPFDTTQARKHQEVWATHLGIPVETTNSIGAKLVVIPPGKFTMGEDDKTVDVTLTKPFLLGQTEVTQGQWKEVMGTEPWKGRDYRIEGADVPVTWISWHEATSFCSKLTDRERSSSAIDADKEYRLPTEAEWEYACRAGNASLFSYGYDKSQYGEHAWYYANSGRLPLAWESDWDTMVLKMRANNCQPHSVGHKKPNAWGLCDMHGNVWEWTADTYASYPQMPVTNPLVKEGDTRRVLRGAGFLSTECPCGLRWFRPPQDCTVDVGFRIALTSSGNR